MVKNGHMARSSPLTTEPVGVIHDLPYRPLESGLPIQTFSLASLIERVGADRLNRVERLAFNLVIVCTEGRGVHEVDFTEVLLQPLRVVHVHPTQVHRWRLADRYEADLVLFPDVADLRLPGWPSGPRSYDLTDIQWSSTREVLSLLRRESATERQSDRRLRALESLRELLIINLGLDFDRPNRTGDLPAAYVAFRDNIESDPVWSRSVSDHARAVGYSPRTINRACQIATGRTAKQIIDQRVILEARRILAHTNRSVSSISDELSFTEPTNFTKFFKRATHETPGQWRSRSGSLVR